MPARDRRRKADPGDVLRAERGGSEHTHGCRVNAAAEGNQALLEPALGCIIAEAEDQRIKDILHFRLTVGRRDQGRQRAQFRRAAKTHDAQLLLKGGQSRNHRAFG